MSQKLRDIAANQAGTIVSFVGTAATNIIGSGFAVVNVLTLLIITPIVTFYFLRDWPGIIRHVDTWLPRPYEGVIRAQAIEVNRILAAWIRGQAICCLVLAAGLRRRPDHRRARSRPDRRPRRRAALLHPLCRHACSARSPLSCSRSARPPAGTA